MTLLACSLMHFNTCIGSCNINHNQNKKQSCYPPNSLLLSLCCTFHPDPLPSLHNNHWSILHHYGYIFLRMPYKWNNTIYNLLRLASFFSIMPLRFFKLLSESIVHFFLLSNSTTVCLSIHPLKNIWVISTLGILQIMLLWTSVYRFYVNISVNTQEWDCWIIW